MTGQQTTTPAEPEDIRPLVARSVTNRGLWLFAGTLAIGATALFAALESRREAITSPAVTAPGLTPPGGVISAPPELAIPPDPALTGYAQNQSPPGYMLQTPQTAAAPAQISRPALVQPTPSLPPYSGPLAAAPASPAPAPSPAFAFQAPQKAAPSASPSGAVGDDKRNDERAFAAKLLNPATTVPQGTVIQAVMETAFDSTRPGFARAVVSRDVSGFDGTRVLVPRGSKLFGEYKADLASGQNRAIIQWHRLTRPDGSIIDVDSPAADPLGRMGVKGKVNSHFFARFGGAILQTALDLGVQIATRKATGDTFIVGFPNNIQNVQNAAPRIQDIKPTLTLKQGAAVTVFVGRDLDFTEVEQ